MNNLFSDFKIVRKIVFLLSGVGGLFLLLALTSGNLISKTYYDNFKMFKTTENWSLWSVKSCVIRPKSKKCFAYTHSERYDNLQRRLTKQKVLTTEDETMKYHLDQIRMLALMIFILIVVSAVEGLFIAIVFSGILLSTLKKKFESNNKTASLIYFGLSSSIFLLIFAEIAFISLIFDKHSKFDFGFWLLNGGILLQLASLALIVLYLFKNKPNQSLPDSDSK